MGLGKALNSDGGEYPEVCNFPVIFDKNLLMWQRNVTFLKFFLHDGSSKLQVQTEKEL